MCTNGPRGRNDQYRQGGISNSLGGSLGTRGGRRGKETVDPHPHLSGCDQLPWLLNIIPLSSPFACPPGPPGLTSFVFCSGRLGPATWPCSLPLSSPLSPRKRERNPVDLDPFPPCAWTRCQSTDLIQFLGEEGDGGWGGGGQGREGWLARLSWRPPVGFRLVRITKTNYTVRPHQR